MPINNNLEPVKLPMKVDFNCKPVTQFKNNLDSINVTIINAPTIDDLLKYIPEFVNATWSSGPMDPMVFTEAQKLKAVWDVFHGKTLPTAMETINITFCISGISIQEVTHILRHRRASFSADCSGDKWWNEKDALVPTSIQNSTEDGIYDRYCKLVNDAKQLYCDMINTKKISIMDARYILPRCLSTYYYMRMSLNDCIAFIRQRMDKQIQPEADNVMAYRMLLQLYEHYPFMKDVVNIHAPAAFYIKTARTGKGTNLYFPDEDSDKFEYNEHDFIYQSTRDKVCGTDSCMTMNTFTDILKDVDRHVAYLDERADKFFASKEVNINE